MSYSLYHIRGIKPLCPSSAWLHTATHLAPGDLASIKAPSRTVCASCALKEPAAASSGLSHEFVSSVMGKYRNKLTLTSKWLESRAAPQREQSLYED